MIRRLFWLILGAVIGIWSFRKFSATADRFKPRNVAGSVGTGLTDLAYALRDFAADVREAMNEREADLRQATGLDGGTGLDGAMGRGPSAA